MWGKQELQHIYDDWMDENIPQSNVPYEMMDCLDAKYSGQIRPAFVFRSDEDSSDIEKEYYYLRDKIVVCHQKLNMMQYARRNAIECRQEFETTQNMNFPALFGTDRTKILFYIESTVLLARNVLDVAATFFARLLLNRRTDSFNDLSKRLLKEKQQEYMPLQQYFNAAGDNPTHTYRLLCGVTRGRSLRDIIIHQTNIRIEYLEYRENSEKEKLFVIIKDTPPIEFDDLLTGLCAGVEEILRVMTTETYKLIVG